MKQAAIWVTPCGATEVSVEMDSKFRFVRRMLGGDLAVVATFDGGRILAFANRDALTTPVSKSHNAALPAKLAAVVTPLLFVALRKAYVQGVEPEPRALLTDAYSALVLGSRSEVSTPGSKEPSRGTKDSTKASVAIGGGAKASDKASAKASTKVAAASSRAKPSSSSRRTTTTTDAPSTPSTSTPSTSTPPTRKTQPAARKATTTAITSTHRLKTPPGTPPGTPKAKPAKNKASVARRASPPRASKTRASAAISRVIADPAALAAFDDPEYASSADSTFSDDDDSSDSSDGDSSEGSSAH